MSSSPVTMCGYLDVPLDYTNDTDTRIARIAVSKYQAHGLAHSNTSDMSCSIQDGGRTIVINPGGPGGSGFNFVRKSGQLLSDKLSLGQFDVFGFDPRGVMNSLPSISCYPDNDYYNSNSYRLARQGRQGVDPRAHLELMDALNDAVFAECYAKYGDVGRFLGTAFVARDMEKIREALGEPELTGYFASYGTALAQTYASMFPDSVGRMVLDGNLYLGDLRDINGWGWHSLDNITGAFHDGFLGQCIEAGPEHCALARPWNGREVTLASLEARMEDLLESLIVRPLPQPGPSILTFPEFASNLAAAMYDPAGWPRLAAWAAELEQWVPEGAAKLRTSWIRSQAEGPVPVMPMRDPPESDEIHAMVVCGDSYHPPEPESMDYWLQLWQNMSAKSWMLADDLFKDLFACRQFRRYWPYVAEVHRGNLNETLNFPLLLVNPTYDPITPLANARKALQELGENGRLVVHHGYGHATGADPSACTNKIIASYILNGTVPDKPETECHTDENPYLFGQDTLRRIVNASRPL